MTWNTPLTRLKMEIFPLIFPSLLHLLPDEWERQAWEGEREDPGHAESPGSLSAHRSAGKAPWQSAGGTGGSVSALTSWRHWRRCDVAGGNVALLQRPARSNGLENPRSPVQHHPGACYWRCIKHWLRLFRAQLERGKEKVEGRTWCSRVIFFCRGSVFLDEIYFIFILKADAHLVFHLTAGHCYSWQLSLFLKSCRLWCWVMWNPAQLLLSLEQFFKIFSSQFKFRSKCPFFQVRL